MSKNHQVVGIAGLAGSGKSLVADTLVAHGFVRIKFADVLKDMLRSLYRSMDLSDAYIHQKIEGDLKERPCSLLEDQTPRHAMQTLGTEWGRNSIDENFWVNLWMRKVWIGLKTSNVVVDDVRFQNEVAAINRFGIQSMGTLQIIRPDPSRSAGLHASEMGGLEGTQTVENFGTKEQLENTIKYIFNLG